MPDFPISPSPATPLHISCLSRFSGSWDLHITSNSGTLAARDWIANLVSYTPFVLPFPYPLKRFFWINGSTITSTNVDCGIYTVGGAKLASTGSVAMSGANSVQYAAPTATMLLAPGMYYIAWTCDNTTARANAQALSSAATQGGLAGLLQETTGGFGLPATMTPVAWAQTISGATCGITRTTSGF